MQIDRRNRARIAASALAILALAGRPQSALSAAPATDKAAQAEDRHFLDRLVGTWDMTGQTVGKPVHYCATGRRILAAGWVEFHLMDLARPAQYEARVFLSPDPKAHDFVLHWLDQFGGAGARVVATGTRHGNVLHALFPYAEGAFRNAWEYQPARRRWTLTIEAQGADKSWSNFASYTLTPATGRAAAACSARTGR
jgi:hypothetical protein